MKCSGWTTYFFLFVSSLLYVPDGKPVSQVHKRWIVLFYLRNMDGWSLREEENHDLQKSLGHHLLKLLCVCGVWGFRQPEPYVCHGGDGWNIWEAEVQQNKSALRVLPTTGIALELPPQSIPTFKGPYIPLFSTLVFWKLRDFKMRDIFKLYKEICS